MKVVGTIKEVRELVKEWNGKEILFPTESYTTVLGKDTFMMEENPEYKVSFSKTVV